MYLVLFFLPHESIVLGGAIVGLEVVFQTDQVHAKPFKYPFWLPLIAEYFSP